VDTGIYPGFEVSPYYDSLISKLVVWGETRAEAILRMRRVFGKNIELLACERTFLFTSV